MDDTAAVSELREKLQELDTRWTLLNEEYRNLGETRSRVDSERSAIRLAIRSLGGDDGESKPPSPKSPPDSPRPTIRVLATRFAKANGGVVKMRLLLKETQKHGFKSDAGGLHTSLKSMPEFEHSGPGQFTLDESYYDSSRHLRFPIRRRRPR